MFQKSHATSSSREPDRGYPVSVLPKHFFGMLRSRTSGQGERRLAVAVFEDAVHCLERYRNAADYQGRLCYYEAEQWMESREKRHVFSFEGICSTLGLRPHSIRERFHLWREGRLRESDKLPSGMLEQYEDAPLLTPIQQVPHALRSAAEI